MPLHVLHVLMEPRLGGPQLRILAVAEALRPQGMDTTVILPEGPAPFRSLLEARGFPVLQVPLARLRWSRDPHLQLQTLARTPQTVQNLVRILTRQAPSVVHAHGLYQPQAVLAARLAGLPVVWHLNDLLLPRSLVRALAPLILTSARAVITVSQAVRHYVFGRLAHHRRIATVYDPPVQVDPDQAPPRLDPSSLPGKAPRALCVGNLYRVKGQADLLQAMALLKNPASLMIAGAPLDTQLEVARHLERLRLTLGLMDRVFFLGWQDAMAGWYGAADLVVHPSHSEACPLAVLEAMAAGKAVVATAVGGVPELIQHQVSGLLVPPHRPDALALAMDQLLSDPDLAQRLGAAAQAQVRAHFSLEACARRHAEVYRQAALDGPVDFSEGIS